MAHVGDMSYLTKFKHLDLLFKPPSSQKLFYLCSADSCFAPPFDWFLQTEALWEMGRVGIWEEEFCANDLVNPAAWIS